MLPVNVAIDGRALGAGRGGDETYTAGLLEGLAAVAAEIDRFPVFLKPGGELPAPIAGHPAFPVYRLKRQSEVRRYLMSLPRAVRGLSPPVQALHCLIHAPLRPGVNIALQVTDLSFQHWPRYFPLRHRLRLRTLVPIHVRQARVVMTLSEFCRRDLIHTYDLPAEKVFAIPCLVRPPGPPVSTDETERVLAQYRIRRPFFIYLGNRHPRKNLPRLVQAFSLAVGSVPELAGHRLVLAGAPWWRGGGEDREVRLAPPGTVQLLGRLPDDHRDLLVRAATALVYPSIFEGFGLPPLEAMAIGTPVLASKAAALPETLGDAALLVDPFDVSAITRALIRLATDGELRAKLRARGLRHAAQYTARRCGEAAMAAFRVATSPFPAAEEQPSQASPFRAGGEGQGRG